jgi:hypothetical protein
VKKLTPNAHHEHRYGQSYTATLHTEKGDIVIELYADKAPWAVNSFVFWPKITGTIIRVSSA